MLWLLSAYRLLDMLHHLQRRHLSPSLTHFWPPSRLCRPSDGLYKSNRAVSKVVRERILTHVTPSGVERRSRYACAYVRDVFGYFWPFRFLCISMAIYALTTFAKILNSDESVNSDANTEFLSACQFKFGGIAKQPGDTPGQSCSSAHPRSSYPHFCVSLLPNISADYMAYQIPIIHTCPLQPYRSTRLRRTGSRRGPWIHQNGVFTI